VLAAARVCRYCGYRFAPPVERAPAPARRGGSGGGGGAGGLLDMIRVQPSPIEDVPQLVEEWGIELWPDEHVRDDGLCFAEVGRELGYVLVTSSRLRFLVPKRGRGKAPDVRINRELRRLRDARVQRRRLRRVAVLRFDDEEIVVRVETGPQEQLVDLLRTV
jgi:hypothetical protein